MFLTKFQGQWHQYCTGVSQMQFKLVKPGTHMLQDLDMDEQVLNLIDKAVDFDEEAMQYMESLLSKTDRSERNTN